MLLDSAAYFIAYEELLLSLKAFLEEGVKDPDIVLGFLVGVELAEQHFAFLA